MFSQKREGKIWIKEKGNKIVWDGKRLNLYPAEGCFIPELELSLMMKELDLRINH